MPDLIAESSQLSCYPSLPFHRIHADDPADSAVLYPSSKVGSGATSCSRHQCATAEKAGGGKWLLNYGRARAKGDVSERLPGVQPGYGVLVFESPLGVRRAGGGELKHVADARRS